MGLSMMLPNSSLSRGQRYRAGVLLLGCVLALGACKKGGEGEAKGKDGKDKGPEAIPVEVVTGRAPADRRQLYRHRTA